MQGEVINLAGVIGGASTACDNQTQSVLIECAYFDPESIIGKSLKYDINSDAAYKFERGADINCHEEILRRFIHIVEKHANIINVEIFTKDYSDIKFPEIEYDHDKIIKILGYDISRDKCILFLENLGFQLNGDYLQVPSFRNDIVGINDIAEEIARAVGYNQFPNSELNLVSIETQNNQTKLERCLKSYLTDNGFYEVINNPFTDKNSKDSIAIDNPLDSNRDQMRTSLKDALIENLLYNEKRQKESIKLFEISDTYFIDENKNIKNIRKLGLIGSGRRGLNYIDFSSKIDSDYFETLLKPYFEEKNIQVLEKDELNTKNKDDIIYFETQLSNISKEIFEYSLNYTPKYSYNYEKISDFPISIRDLSFAISDQTKLIDLENTVLNFNDPFLKDVYVFDFFNNTKKGELKIGFRFIFQSQDETLKDFQVDNVIKDIVKQALKIESVKIPGLK
jgi:phenylalanyl-tRNA synthetase beta chain